MFCILRTQVERRAQSGRGPFRILGKRDLMLIVRLLLKGSLITRGNGPRVTCYRIASRSAGAIKRQAFRNTCRQDGHLRAAARGTSALQDGQI